MIVFPGHSQARPLAGWQLQDDTHSSALRSCWVVCAPNHTALESLLVLGNLWVIPSSLIFDKALELGYNIKYRISRIRKTRSPAMPTPVSPSSYVISYGNVQDAVLDGIRDMILKGHLKPGDRLRQDELANTFGVSTMPIREALRQLQAEGLVVFRPRRGATVARFTVSDYEEIYCIREALETLACRWAAEDFDRIPIDRLKLLLQEIEAAEANQDDVHRRLQLVREFFFTVFESSEKEHLLRILSNLWDLSQQYRLLFSSLPELVPQRLVNYRNIYQACHDRDPEALVSAFRAIWAVREPTLIPLVRKEENKKQTT
jgi:DNA-binding GntR family transcriptional regulator